MKKKFENSIEIKINLTSIENKNKDIPQIIPLINNIVCSRKWLKFNRYSYRYDTLFLIYTFLVRYYLMNINTEFKNYIIDLYNMILEDILNLNESELNNGIWNIIDRYKNNYEFLKQEYISRI